VAEALIDFATWAGNLNFSIELLQLDGQELQSISQNHPHSL
jgi:hypothetical protein